eukprot:532346-Pleurochrysis_carterae.AAC.2
MVACTSRSNASMRRGSASALDSSMATPALSGMRGSPTLLLCCAAWLGRSSARMNACHVRHSYETTANPGR